MPHVLCCAVMCVSMIDTFGTCLSTTPSIAISWTTSVAASASPGRARQKFTTTTHILCRLHTCVNVQIMTQHIHDHMTGIIALTRRSPEKVGVDRHLQAILATVSNTERVNRIYRLNYITLALGHT